MVAHLADQKAVQKAAWMEMSMDTTTVAQTVVTSAFVMVEC